MPDMAVFFYTSPAKLKPDLGLGIINIAFNDQIDSTVPLDQILRQSQSLVGQRRFHIKGGNQIRCHCTQKACNRPFGIKSNARHPGMDINI